MPLNKISIGRVTFKTGTTFTTVNRFIIHLTIGAGKKDAGRTVIVHRPAAVSINMTGTTTTAAHIMDDIDIGIFICSIGLVMAGNTFSTAEYAPLQRMIHIVYCRCCLISMTGQTMLLIKLIGNNILDGL